MAESIVKLKEIVGRDVPLAEAGDVAQYLLACLIHITNARPLFGVVNTETAVLEWAAGGADFYDLLCVDHAAMNDAAMNEFPFGNLMKCLGVSPDVSAMALDQMKAMAPGGWVSLAHPMAGVQGRYFRLVLRRRHAPHQNLVQFSLLDITAFQQTALRTQAMALALVEQFNVPIHQGEGTKTQLLGILDGLETLFTLQHDADIQALAQSLSDQVTRVSERMVALLRGFEEQFESSHWQPAEVNSNLRSTLAVHSTPVTDWQALLRSVSIKVEGEAAISGVDALSLKSAFDFVTHAGSTLVVAPKADAIFILNGPVGAKPYGTIEDFVRALGVEENSTRTAIEFFSGLSAKPAMGLFAVGGENVEAWGRPGLYGGWQAMLTPSQGQSVDVRGLFHGLKNLLLHLQVLYVVKTRVDVDQVRRGLSETSEKIKSRLNDLNCIANTGRRVRSRGLETVGQWLEAAADVGRKGVGNVHIDATDDVKGLRYLAFPGEMEDTLEELAMNAFVHGASNVQVEATVQGQHLCLRVIDDGRGMDEAKLAQLRTVLDSRAYDATLSTREGGTGNGLLSAANAVSRFVDGRFLVDHGPQGRGVSITLSMKLPGSL